MRGRPDNTGPRGVAGWNPAEGGGGRPAERGWSQGGDFPPHVVIMAGGKGTRIASIAGDLPKPMIPVAGKPVLEYEIGCLRRNGLTGITIVVGPLGDRIKERFGDGGAFGCRISYYTETEPLGTAGALYRIAPELTDDFILLNGDTIFDVDFGRFIEFHRKRKAWASLAVHPNSHPYDSALLVSDGEDRVVTWLNKEDPRGFHKNQVNAGLHILSRKLLEESRPSGEKVDLDRDILKPLIPSGRIFVYSTPEYIKDMGTPDRYRETGLDIERGLVAARNLSRPQRAVFLDRDGTINRLDGFITRPEDLVLIDGAAEAIRRINQAGWLAIVITNQPVIARGDLSVEGLERLHHKMETDLGAAGAYVEDIFYCPHHPDKGYPGERPEYKIDCGCRKPKPGLILRAAAKYHIDLARSYMAGDDPRDVEAAVAAGCKPVLLAQDRSGPVTIAGRETPVFPDLLSFVEKLVLPGME